MSRADWNTVAVLPTNDIVEHDGFSDDCICGPTTQPVERDDGSIGWLLVHHSLATSTQRIEGDTP